MFRDIKTAESSFVWFHRVLDSTVPILTLIVATHLNSVAWHDRYTIMGILGVLFFILSAQAMGAYINWRDSSPFHCIKPILNSWALSLMALIVIAFLSKDTSYFSRLAVGIWGVMTPLVLISYRLLGRALLVKYTGNIRKVAIVGAGKMGQQVANALQSNKWVGYSLVAYFDDNVVLHNTTVNTVPVMGNLDQIAQFANAHFVDELYICLPLRAEYRIKQLLNQLTNTTVIVKFIPDFFTFDLMQARWSEINGIPVISIFDTPFSSRTAQFIKRSEDIIISILILIIISPILVVLAIGVKLSSAGPVLFKQKRYGINGKEIIVYKFRSMRTQDNGSIIKQAIKGDPRITKFGAFIRRTSLDELPQFYNVLQGNMSIAGPRPHAVAHNEEYRQLIPKYMQRHLVKPGITGWAQINGWRGETDTLDKMENRINYDLYYINNWSLWLDIKIILITIIKGFVNKNAY